MSNSTAPYGGYTCRCGVFVPFGQNHTCPTPQTPINYTQMYSSLGYFDLEVLERIAVALERIVDNLDEKSK